MNEKNTKHLTSRDRANLQVFLTNLHQEKKLPLTKTDIWTVVAAKGFDCSWNAIGSILDALGIDYSAKRANKDEKPKSYGRSNRAVAWAVERLASNQAVANLVLVNHLARVTQDEVAKEEINEMFRSIQRANEAMIEVLKDVQSGRKIESYDYQDFQLEGGEV
tara:strand:+ start:177 stop:665 length:489 start_codon:yes stop_codon:yes gene_type:complete